MHDFSGSGQNHTFLYHPEKTEYDEGELEEVLMNKLFFASDYQEGMCEEILERLQQTNRIPTSGYGTDEYSEQARSRIKEACGAPDARIHFLSGGTQTNQTVIACMKPGRLNIPGTRC